MALARRAVMLAALAAAALALSGCFQLFTQGFDPTEPPMDPPVHGNDIGASPDSVAATGGRPFRGRAAGQLGSRMTIRHGFVKTKSNWARFFGTYRSTLADDEALGPLSSAQWHGRFRTVRNRATGRFAISGLVLATFDDATAGRACLRLASRGRRRQNRRPTRAGLSNLTVLGGEGGARTLRGTARVRVRLARDNSLRLRGRVKARRGAARGLNPACTKLERKFGLQPAP
jgi:hypothetical protein